MQTLGWARRFEQILPKARANASVRKFYRRSGCEAT
jgi:hypothetical protein